jgi:hypothetical protein
VTARGGRPLTAIVSSADIAEQGTLDADYWVNRRGTEDYPAFRRRRQADDIDRRAAQHEAIARRLRAEAAELRGETPQ